MKKELTTQKVEPSYVYPVNEENLNKFKHSKNKLISKDKKYLLIYSDAHLEEIYDYFKWLDQQDYLSRCSITDAAFEDLLVEANIKPEFDTQKYKSFLTKADGKDEKVIIFDDPNHIFSHVLCNVEDLNNGQAPAEYIQVAASVEDYGKKVEDVIPAGYFRYQKKEVK